MKKILLTIALVLSLAASAHATAFFLGGGGGGGSTSPGGTDGQLQYNNGGSFGGFAWSWDDVNDQLNITGNNRNWRIDASALNELRIGQAGGGDTRITFDASNQQIRFEDTSGAVGFDVLIDTGGQLRVGAPGIEFVESDSNPACAAGNYNIFADLSETTLKKCVNGTVTDLDTGGSGSGAFSDASDPVVLNTTTKDVVIGTGQVNGSKLTVDGDADQTQVTIQGNATQTNPLLVFEDSAGTVLASVDEAGNAQFASVEVPANATDGGKVTLCEDTDIGTDCVEIAVGQEDLPTGTTTYNVNNAYRDAIEFLIDGGGSAIGTGIHGDIEIPWTAEILRGTVLCDQTGSITVDVWVDTFANYPPTNTESITASAPLTVTTAAASQDTTLTGWTTTLAAGSTMRFNVDSATTVTRCTVSLLVDKRS